MEKKCIYCNNKFIAKRNDAKYCSSNCAKYYWNSNNKNKLKEYNKQWKRNYRKENYEKDLEYQKQWRNNNKQKQKEYFKLRNSKQETIIKRNNRRKERRKQEPMFAIMENVRRRINEYINNKRLSTIEIIGCTPLELKQHLENQFVKGMSWENRNEWHIDHIIPLSSASNQEELFKLCHYSNLQPLWAIDNIKKSNKILN